MTVGRGNRSQVVVPTCPFLDRSGDDEPYLCLAQSEEGTPVKPIYAAHFCVKMRHVSCRYFVKADRDLKRAALAGELHRREPDPSEEIVSDVQLSRKAFGRSRNDRIPQTSDAAARAQGLSADAETAAPSLERRARPGGGDQSTIFESVETDRQPTVASESDSASIGRPAESPRAAEKEAVGERVNDRQTVAEKRTLPTRAPAFPHAEPGGSPGVSAVTSRMSNALAATVKEPKFLLVAALILGLAVAIRESQRLGHTTTGHPVARGAPPARSRGSISAPIGLRARQLNATHALFAWSQVPRARGYVIDVAGHRFKTPTSHLFSSIGLQPGRRYAWSVTAIGPAGINRMSSTAFLEARPLPAITWSFGAFHSPVQTAYLTVSNPRAVPADIHLKLLPSTVSTALSARIPAGASVEIGLEPGRASSARGTLGVVVTASSPVVAQRGVISGGQSHAAYGIPMSAGPAG